MQKEWETYKQKFVCMCVCKEIFLQNINAHFYDKEEEKKWWKIIGVPRGRERAATAVVDINKPAHSEAWERKKLINKFLIIRNKGWMKGREFLFIFF